MQELKTLGKAFCWARKIHRQTQPLILPSSRFAWDKTTLSPHVLQSIFRIFLFEFVHEVLDFRARTATECLAHFLFLFFELDALRRSIEGIEGSIFYSSSLRVFHMEHSMSIFIYKYFFAAAWRLA
jgi:hypothetical protein